MRPKWDQNGTKNGATTLIESFAVPLSSSEIREKLAYIPSSAEERERELAYNPNITEKRETAATEAITCPCLPRRNGRSQLEYHSSIEGKFAAAGRGM